MKKINVERRTTRSVPIKITTKNILMTVSGEIISATREFSAAQGLDKSRISKSEAALLKKYAKLS